MTSKQNDWLLDDLPDLNDVEACQTQAKKLLKSRPAYKGKVTAALKSVQDSLDMIEDLARIGQINQAAMDKVQEDGAIMTRQFNRLAAVNFRLAELIGKDEKGEDFNQTAQALKAEQSKNENTLMKNLSKHRSKLLAKPGNQSEEKVRLKDGLKPRLELEEHHSPQQYETWKFSFKRYYHASKLYLESVADQQGYLVSCIHYNFWPTIQQKITNDTVIWAEDAEPYGANSIEKVLDELFITSYPLIRRRYDFFACKQGENEGYRKFFTRAKTLHYEADITSMDGNEHLVYRAIVGCSDKKLQEKFFTIPLDQLSLVEIDRIATCHESGKALTESRDFARKTNGSKTLTPKQSQRKEALKKMRDEGKCTSCGNKNPGHDLQNCPHRGSICGNCNLKGHSKGACLNPKQDDKGATTDGKPNSDNVRRVILHN